MPLTQEQLAELLNPVGKGPIKHCGTDYSLRCDNTEQGIVCATPCHYILWGKHYCTIHLIRTVNEVLVERGMV